MRMHAYYEGIYYVDTRICVHVCAYVRDYIECARVRVPDTRARPNNCRFNARSMLSAILEGDHHLSILQQSPIRLLFFPGPLD